MIDTIVNIWQWNTITDLILLFWVLPSCIIFLSFSRVLIWSNDKPETPYQMENFTEDHWKGLALLSVIYPLGIAAIIFMTCIVIGYVVFLIFIEGREKEIKKLFMAPIKKLW